MGVLDAVTVLVAGAMVLWYTALGPYVSKHGLPASALNARARESAIIVVDAFNFDGFNFNASNVADAFARTDTFVRTFDAAFTVAFARTVSFVSADARCDARAARRARRRGARLADAARHARQAGHELSRAGRAPGLQARPRAEPRRGTRGATGRGGARRTGRRR